MKGFLALLLSIIAVGAAQARPDLNAFLNKRAANLHELITQVKTDKVVMDRYCRHYQVTPAQVIAHLKRLRPGMIMKPELYAVYSVPNGGALKRHLQILKRGTPVYLGEDGKPELVATCGNPLRAPEPTVELTVDVAEAQETMRDVSVAPVFLTEVVPPDVEPPLIETTVETPVDEVVTTGDSAIPIAALNAASLLFPVSLFVVTTNGPTNSTPSPAAAIPFVVGAAWLARRRARTRR